MLIDLLSFLKGWQWWAARLWKRRYMVCTR